QLPVPDDAEQHQRRAEHAGQHGTPDGKVRENHGNSGVEDGAPVASGCRSPYGQAGTAGFTNSATLHRPARIPPDRSRPMAIKISSKQQTQLAYLETLPP